MNAPTGPLPTGFGVVLDADTKRLDDSTLFGGSPARVLRLSSPGRVAFAELLTGSVRTRTGGQLARRLTDAGVMHPRPPATPQPLDVTVLVPVRDRTAMLARCLDALGPRYAVVVVDDGSRDPGAVAAVCAERGARLVRRNVTGGPAVARNTGLDKIHSEFVAFVDSDCVPSADWLDRLAPQLADPTVGAVAPRVRALDASTLIGRYSTACGSLDLGDREARVTPLTRVAYVPTAALVVRRSALLDVAGDGQIFDPELRFGEDVDLIWRMTGAGWRVRYDPSVTVGHDEPDTWPALLTRRFRYGTSAGPLARRHPTAIPPFVIHPWSFATVVAVLSRRPVLAMAAFVGSVAALTRTLRRARVRRDGVVRASATAITRSWLGLGRLSTQFAVPVLLAAILNRRPAANGRRLAAASLLLGPPIHAWVTRRPDLDPVRFVLAHIADDVMYGAGVWAGSVRARTIVPLCPIMSAHALGTVEA